MPFAAHDGLRLHYECFGAADAPAVLLLAGTGRQSIDFDAPFCEALTAQGYRVIRFDTRDTGLSSGLAGTPSNLEAVHRAALAGEPTKPAYGVAELADDALAVLDAASVSRAHLVGRSLGSAVAQMIALRAPDRVLSLALIMANSRSVASELPEAAVARIASETIDSVDDFVARQVRTASLGAMPDDFDAERVGGEAREMWQRGIHPGGIARHFAAAVGMPDLRELLGNVTVPTVILHGSHDRTIPPSYARETADAISGSWLEMLDDMSHDGAPRVRQRWLPYILENLARARGTA